MVTKEFLKNNTRDFAEGENRDFDGIWNFLERVFDIKDENDEKEISEIR